MFCSVGVDVCLVFFKLKFEMRKVIIVVFGKGEFLVLINCEVLIEGIDIF